MDLLAKRRLRDVLALRRVGEATLLRDRDKIPKLMNFHRCSDTPLGPPVCLRLVNRMALSRKRLDWRWILTSGPPRPVVALWAGRSFSTPRRRPRYTPCLKFPRKV